MTHPVVVAIHQPNYLPWLGYFSKLAQCDTFVFLDDAQFSKGSYTNRVKIAAPCGERWLTIPVSVHLGDTISAVKPSSTDWSDRHLDTLRGAYRPAPHFNAVFPDVAAILREAAYCNTLAAINITIVIALARKLGISADFLTASALATDGQSDDRLVAIVGAVSANATYLSGRGGAAYQDPRKFEHAGLGFCYSQFAHPTYTQHTTLAGRTFLPGLSIVDALFNMGWEITSAMVHAGTHE